MNVFSELLAQKPQATDRPAVAKKEPLATIERPAETRRTPGDAATTKRPQPLAVPTLRLNLERLARLGMVTPGLENTRVVEEYRYIKRSLLAATFGAPSKEKYPNLVVITSSHPGEGKTFNAINLALSVAMERDHHVLLIDGDIERAGLSRTLGVSKRIGLSNYLLDDRVTVASTMFKVNGVERLRVMPSGPLRHDASELLASSRMKAFVEETASRYPDRLVIVDSAPLLASSAARVLAELAGQVIVIVAANDTSMNSLDESLKNIPEEKPVRLILNKTMVSDKDNEYRYGYYKPAED